MTKLPSRFLETQRRLVLKRETAGSIQRKNDRNKTDDGHWSFSIYHLPLDSSSADMESVPQRGSVWLIRSCSYAEVVDVDVEPHAIALGYGLQTLLKWKLINGK